MKTTDKSGESVEVGDRVRYRLSDSLRDSEGTVTEILESGGGMYARNARNGFADLLFPHQITKCEQTTSSQMIATDLTGNA